MSLDGIFIEVAPGTKRLKRGRKVLAVSDLNFPHGYVTLIEKNHSEPGVWDLYL